MSTALERIMTMLVVRSTVDGFVEEDEGAADDVEVDEELHRFEPIMLVGWCEMIVFQAVISVVVTKELGLVLVKTVDDELIVVMVCEV